MRRAVIKFINGKEITALIQFFNPSKPAFPIVIENEEGKEEIHSIHLNEVKALIFLKEDEDVKGPHLHMETIDQTVYAGSVSTKLIVEFKDGEVLHGSTLKYNPFDKGFFLIPLNPGDVSDRIYINAQAVKRVEKTKLLGRILVDQQKITPDQLDKALIYQRERREKKIGAILVEHAVINEHQLQDSLKVQKEKNKMLGEILLDAGYITREQLNVALRIQHDNRKKKLGEILVDLKYVTPNDICVALSSQLEFPWMDLSKENIPIEIATALSEEIVRKFDILPVAEKDDKTLIIASANPSISDLMKELKKVTSRSIEFVIVYDGYLSAAIKNFFPPKAEDAKPTPDKSSSRGSPSSVSGLKK